MIPFADGDRTFYRVRVGLETDFQEAEAYEQHQEANGFPETFHRCGMSPSVTWTR
jgi:hypothetical protein